MQTTIGHGITPAGSIFTGEGSAVSDEIAFRMRRLACEAHGERLAGSRDGLRHHVGHALIALGRAIHGIEPEHGARSAGRPALDAR
jgi:hypothetical protein